MVITLVYFLLVILSLYKYQHDRFASYLLFFVGVQTGMFGILPRPEVKVTDLTSLIIVVLFLLHYKEFDFKRDIVGKWIIRLFLYFCIIGIFSWVLKLEYLQYILLLIRLELYLFCYFIFKRIPYDQFVKGFNLFYRFSLINCILYYLQYVGITGILNFGGEVDMDITQANLRLMNIPYFSAVMLFYTMLDFRRNLWGGFRVLLFAGCIVLSQSRGLMASCAFMIVLLLFIRGKAKGIIALPVMAGLIILLFGDVITNRFSQAGSTGKGVISEMKDVYGIWQSGNVNLFDNSVIYTEGTGVFRGLYVLERIKYLSDSPLKLLFGSGVIHSSSPNIQKFSFHIRQVNRDLVVDNTRMIDTTDVAFISHVFRYGFVYLAIFLYILWLIASRSYKSRNIYNTICWLLIGQKLFTAFGQDGFLYLDGMLPILLIASQYLHIKNDESHLELSHTNEENFKS